jgi:hypothetical protein
MTVGRIDMTLKIGTVFKTMLWSALVGASATLVACGGGGSDAPAPAAGMGTVRVALTDAPRCKVGNEDLDKVFVTVEQVRINKSSDDGVSTGWYDIDVRPARKINLLDLTNGRLEELGTVPLPAGTYSQVRLVLSPNRGASTPANSVVVAGSLDELPLQTPSAAQSGLKIIRPFTVAPNTTVDLVIDFDACRSIVLRGNGTYLLKPVLTADLKHVGAIVGHVDSTLTGVTVTAQKNGTVVRSTIPAPNGAFSLSFLDSAYSPYDVVITAPAKATAAVVAVPAVNAVTPISTSTDPIKLLDSATAKASGTVGPAGALAAGASVRATQAIGTTAPNIIPVAEVAHVNVNPDTGAYELTLPTAPAQFAAFSTTLPLTFTAQVTKSSYSFEAFAPGYATQRTAVLEVPQTLLNFTLMPAP